MLLHVHVHVCTCKHTYRGNRCLSCGPSQVEAGVFFRCRGSRARVPVHGVNITAMIETICHIKKPRKPVCRKIKPSRHFRVGYQPSIPSLFYEYNKERFCNDDQTKEEIVVEYEDWLRNSDKPRQQMRTTSELTKAFGITDFSFLLDEIYESGFALFKGPADSSSPWGGCELLLV